MAQRYTKIASSLHWLIAIVILGNFALGLYMTDLPLSPLKLQRYAWHKWAGVSVFVLVLLRLLWRMTHKPPPPVAMPRWQRMLAESTHHLLYLLMVAIPLSGWLMSSAKGFQTVWFGVLPLPDLVHKNAVLANGLHTTHEALNYLLLLLLIGHVGAALQHHFIKHDGLLSRMNPFGNAD